jgi:hypothetical protein
MSSSLTSNIIQSHFGRKSRKPKRKSVWWSSAVIVFCGFLMFDVAAFADPTQWSGNGHWYEAILVGTNGITWTDARNAAIAKGGYLVTIASAAENQFAYSLVSGNDDFWLLDPSSNGIGPWLGGYQYDKLAEPAGHWRWLTSEAWNYTNWAPPSEPNNFYNQEDWLIFFGYKTLKNSTWDDFPNNGWPGDNVSVRGYIVEYDSVPEPSTFILSGMGAVSLLAYAWRRKLAM